MHGQIALDSELGRGTKARFWIPFNKSQFPLRDSPLVQLDSIPTRLQSEMSMSGRASEARSSDGTPPISPGADSIGVRGHRKQQHSRNGSLNSPMGLNEEIMPEIDRKRIHVLVVEDKYVPSSLESG